VRDRGGSYPALVPRGDDAATESDTLMRDRHKIPITILICDDDPMTEVGVRQS